MPTKKKGNDADLFGPMLTADSNKTFVLCFTDAFTKYTVVISIQNKNAETVADAIFKEWFCKFGIPAQIHTDGGKEFVNKFSAEMMELMNVSHTRWWRWASRKWERSTRRSVFDLSAEISKLSSVIP